MARSGWIGREPGRVVIAWTVAGVAWFTLLWVAIHGVVRDERIEGMLEIGGGVMFVAISALLMHRMLDRNYRQLRRVNEALDHRLTRRTEELQAEIADRTRAEKSLQICEQRFRDFTTAMSDWLWETGADYRIAYLSQRFVEVTGLPLGDVVGRRFVDVLGGEAERTLEQGYLIARRAFRDVLVTVPTPQGERVYALSGRPIFDSLGGFAGFRGTGADVSDEQAARASAERSQRRQAQILDSLGEGVLGIDAEGRIDVVNPAARAMLGWGGDGLIGQPLAEVMGEAAEGLAHGARRSDRSTLRRRDGSTLPVDYVLAPVSEHGRMTGAVLAFRDRSSGIAADLALREAKEAAERATEAKSQFLARMSHQLRTPLNAILGFADIVLSELFGPIGNTRYRDYLTDIRRSGQHLHELMDDILDLSRIESGQLELTESAVNLAELVEAAFAMVRPDASRAGCALVNNVPGNLPAVLVDLRRFKQILLNLLANAVKYTPSGGRVTVSAEVVGDGSLALRVSDTGAGIAAEDLPRVTDLYGPADGRPGGGLGLPLSKQLVELHGGKLTIDSQIGQGTTVDILLPPTRLAALQRPAEPF